MTQRTCTIDECSRPCRAKGRCKAHYSRWLRTTAPEDRARPTEQERFASRAQPTPSGCIIWTGALDHSGYGRFGNAAAHRYALEQRLGRPLGVGMFACHSCDTPACVNPDHLFEGSHQDNVNDSVRKGRNSHGERNGHHKLTAAAVRDIRARAANGAKQADLARQYGIGATAISKIVAHERWKNA